MNYDIQEMKSKHSINSDIVRQMDIIVQNNNQKQLLFVLSFDT